MKKYFRVRGGIILLSSMCLCLVFAFISVRMGIDTFSRSAPLALLMEIIEFLISCIILLLIICIVIYPFFLVGFFQNNGVKKWKALLPIYNIRVLLGIIGIETRSFSTFLLGMIVGIVLLLLQPRYQCPCYGYGEFLVSVFLFTLCTYSLGFMVFIFCRLFKYNSDRKKINDESN